MRRSLNLAVLSLGILSAGADVNQLTVLAHDGHPIRVFGTASTFRPGESLTVLLLHGRTWSSGPVWALEYPASGDDSSCEAPTASFLERLARRGVNAYAMDFRGFGDTAEDATGSLTPLQAADDVLSVLEWLQKTQRAGEAGLVLMGWSQGAAVAHLAAQKKEVAHVLDGLVLYGSIFNVHAAPVLRPPLFSSSPPLPPRAPQTLDESLGDFTVPGSVGRDLAMAFAEAVLEADPLKGRWAEVDQFLECTPSRLPPTLPVLLIHGARDPYVDKRSMSELFEKMEGEHKQYVVIPRADHPVHLLFGDNDEGLSKEDAKPRPPALIFEEAVHAFLASL